MRKIEAIQLRPEEGPSPLRFFDRIPLSQQMPHELRIRLWIPPIQQRVAGSPDGQIEMNGKSQGGKCYRQYDFLNTPDESPIHGKYEKSVGGEEQDDGLVGAE